MSRKQRKFADRRPAARALASAGAPPAPRTLWIISPAWDTFLFIGAPAVSIAALYPWRTFWAPEQYAAFLLAFLTFGHHLPGFIRAYGDRDLFRRYRWRFLLAPPLVFLAALAFSKRGLHGLLLLTFTWDIWHVLMQHYGFMRIYDAKRGEISPLTARLDMVFSLSAYVALIVASPHYRGNLLYLAYQSGVPLLTTQLYELLETAIFTIAALSAAAYIAYHAWLWRQGRLNPLKIATLAAFLGATYYLYIHTSDFAVGFAVWSGFHCLQYYGIVWVFNRSVVAKGGAVAKFVRFLFRPSAAMVALYASLILLYGGIDYGRRYVTSESVTTLLLAFVATSAFLHYYYDGFIWKVREKDTRANLGIESARPDAAQDGLLSSAKSAWAWLQRLQPNYQRGVFQAGYLGCALVVLGSLELYRPHDDLSMHQALSDVARDSDLAQMRLGESLRARGETAQAVDAFRAALRANPASAQARVMLGLMLLSEGKLSEAATYYEEALQADPNIAEAHFNLAAILESRGEIPAATEHFTAAARSEDEQVRRPALEALSRLRAKP